MKTNNEIFELVLSRKEEYETQRTARNKRLAAAGAGVMAVAICVGIGVAALKGNTPIVKAGGEDKTEACWVEASGNAVEQTAVTRPNDPTSGEEAAILPLEQGSETTQTTKIYGGANVPDEGTTRAGAPEKKPAETTTATPKDGSGSVYGGDTQSGGWYIPARPDAAGAKPGVKSVGEKITDAEVKAYLSENKTWLASSLSASGVAADSITFSPTGYCHVSYDGVEGKQLEVRENVRDYLAYNNGKLVSIITITKENGRLSATPAFGGTWFSEYDAFLKAHKGEKLLYVYAGWMEIVITPDGHCYNPQGADVSAYMEGYEEPKDPYAYFYSEAATYTP